MGKRLTALLLHHPDVEIVNACAPQLAGLRLDQTIPGMAGDTDMVFSATYNPGEGDVLFLTEQNTDAQETGVLSDKIKIVDLSGKNLFKQGYVDGVPELNRKPMVRGAHLVALPSRVSNLLATVLFPVADILDSNTEVVLTDIFPESDDVDKDLLTTQQLLSHVLPAVNVSLRADASGAATQRHMDVHDLENRQRFMTLTVRVKSALDYRHLVQRFHDRYDDHNFVYLVQKKPDAKSVVGTNKCMICIEPQENDQYEITAAIDPVLKAEAGGAVHCMNLLFGLHERIGLNLHPW